MKLILALALFLNVTFPDSVRIKEAHEYYFSVMTIERNPSKMSLEVELRIFSDDLELALGQTDDFRLRLGDEREVENADSLIVKYLEKNIDLSGECCKSIKMNYVGKKVDYDITYIYLEYLDVLEWGNVEIRNTVLFNEYSNQQNQISLVVGEQILTESTYRESPTALINIAYE